MLPEKFKERMKRILGDEYDKFELALTNESAVRAFRINRCKIKDPDSFSTTLGTERIPYEPYGFVLDDEVHVGHTHEHHSGAIYVQDPGAMAALNALDIKEGWWAIDLCAAPGGKSSQIAERIGEGGFLISNEFVPKRAKLLVGNFERLGIKNAVVTSLDTKEFPKLFDGVFDLVLADVPCSGEGMFRKSEEALSEWSEENVASCAKRQREILENASHLVKSGGFLVYSTCTFSLEENEENVLEFIEKHPEFTLVPVKEEILKYTSPAIDTSSHHPEIALAARRFYPHVSKGEGQFVALLQRAEERKLGKILFSQKNVPPSMEERKAAEAFFKKYLTKKPCGEMIKQGENLAIISHGGVLPPKSVFCVGVLLGEARKGLLFPSHHFFCAFGDLFLQKINLTEEDQRLKKYLSGEQIPCDAGFSGWCAVLVNGVLLGGGKASGGILKNHYPKGLRTR